MSDTSAAEHPDQQTDDVAEQHHQKTVGEESVDVPCTFCEDNYASPPIEEYICCCKCHNVAVRPTLNWSQQHNITFVISVSGRCLRG